MSTILSKAELDLFVELRPDNGSRDTLKCTLFGSALEERRKSFPPVSLEGLEEHLHEFLRDIDEARQLETTEPLEAEKKIQRIGSYLTEHLFEENLRETLWQMRDEVKTLWIISEDVVIPWELLRLEHRTGDGGTNSGPFLGQTFEVMRGLSSSQASTNGLANQLQVRSIAVIAPSGRETEATRLEIQPLLDLKSQGVNVEILEANSQIVERTFAEARFDILHFVGHGSAPRSRKPDTVRLGSPPACGSFLDLDSKILTGEAKGMRRRPALVFVNTCHSARGGASLRGSYGWPVRSLRAGAKAFLGANWTLSNDKASEFARFFYKGFLGGKHFARAVHDARRAIQEAHDSSWLAYTAFGHPALQASIGTTPAKPKINQIESDHGKAQSHEVDAAHAESAVDRRSEQREGRVHRKKRQRESEPKKPLSSEVCEKKSSSYSGEGLHIGGIGHESLVHPGTGMAFVKVPAGKYVLGCTKPHCGPTHRVLLSSFWISRWVVSNRQYELFLRATGLKRRPAFWDCPRFNAPDQPVVGISWFEATAFCQWAELALPSEAQWEVAARGGDRRPYPWGVDRPCSSLACFAPHADRPAPSQDYQSITSPFGTQDQIGNVWEWCFDTWNANALSHRDFSSDPVEFSGETGVRHVIRGGSWRSFAGDLHVAIRSQGPSRREDSQGFRCVWPRVSVAGG